MTESPKNLLQNFSFVLIYCQDDMKKVFEIYALPIAGEKVLSHCDAIVCRDTI